MLLESHQWKCGIWRSTFQAQNHVWLVVRPLENWGNEEHTCWSWRATVQTPEQDRCCWGWWEAAQPADRIPHRWSLCLENSPTHPAHMEVSSEGRIRTWITNTQTANGQRFKSHSDLHVFCSVPQQTSEGDGVCHSSQVNKQNGRQGLNVKCIGEVTDEERRFSFDVK